MLILNSDSLGSSVSADDLTIGNLVEQARARNFANIPVLTTTGQWNWSVADSSKCEPLLVLCENGNAKSPSLVVVKVCFVLNKHDYFYNS